MVPFLQTERLILKKVTEENCTDRYLSWLQDHEVNRFLESGLFPQSLQDLSNYVNGVTPQTLFLAIYTKASLDHIGNIKIDSIDFRNGLGEYGILMGEKEEWGKGYAKEATVAVLGHCFNKLNLRKVTLGVVESNVLAVKLYQKLGFVIEGTLKDHKYYDGAYRDILRMALFRKTYEQ
jgi:[ribosomal protein S5]-alanine N-acetyltransferase